MSGKDISDQEPADASNMSDSMSDNMSDAGNSSNDNFFDADDRLVEMEAKLRAAQTEVLKSHAEVENFRKRLQRDAEQQLRYANIPLIRDMLDVIDNLKRATDVATNESGNSPALLEGVKMVTQQLVNILAKFGCKPIESVGKPFDPNFHEAITQMSSTDVPAGSVLQEVAVGYLLHDRVIRPSQVIVSTGA
jgi:molecular chaperone GrpE